MKTHFFVNFHNIRPSLVKRYYCVYSFRFPLYLLNFLAYNSTNSGWDASLVAWISSDYFESLLLPPVDSDVTEGVITTRSNRMKFMLLLLDIGALIRSVDVMQIKPSTACLRIQNSKKNSKNVSEENSVLILEKSFKYPSQLFLTECTV